MKLTWVNDTLVKLGFRLIKTRMTGGIIESSKQSNPFGFESNPTKNYIAILSETLGNEEPVIVGFLNPKALESLNKGDSQIYSTDSDGVRKATVTLRSDGTAELLGSDDFMVRYSKLESAFNTLKSDFNKFLVHVHGVAGTPPAPPQLPTTADITQAKIEEIKTI